MKSLMIISGWAHGIKSIEPFKNKFSDKLVVKLLSASKALQMTKLPSADFVIGISLGGMIAIDKLPANCKKLVRKFAFVPHVRMAEWSKALH